MLPLNAILDNRANKWITNHFDKVAVGSFFGRLIDVLIDLMFSETSYCSLMQKKRTAV